MCVCVDFFDNIISNRNVSIFQRRRKKEEE